MIRVLTLLSLLSISSILIAQVTIEAEVDSILTIGTTTEYGILGRVNVTNNGVDTATFTWVRDESNLVEGWRSFIYDQIQCSFLTIDSRSFDLFPGQVGYLQFHLVQNEICGEGYGVMTLTEDSDTTNFVEIRYDFIVNNDDGSPCEITSSVNNSKLANIQAYPNPAIDFFKLTDTPLELECIQMYNILGSRVKTYWLMGDMNYDISDLPSGIYLISLISSKGKNLKTMKLHKE